MTAQFTELLRYQGEDLALCSNPLDEYFAMGGANPGFVAPCTALWRGYAGSWEIVGGRLYLIKVVGQLLDGTDASIESVFSGFPERVFAHWYSGTLRVPQGELLNYVHAGYRSSYERDLLLDVDRGVIQGNRVRVNGALPQPKRRWAKVPTP